MPDTVLFLRFGDISFTLSEISLKVIRVFSPDASVAVVILYFLYNRNSGQQKNSGLVAGTKPVPMKNMFKGKLLGMIDYSQWKIIC